MKKILVLIASIITLSSCEKEIDLDLNSSNPKYVIEGEVVQDQFAKIKISKTVNFSESNNFPAVKAAEVIISDNTGNTEILKETSAGVYTATKIKGEINKTYTLNVKAEGNIFSAKSTMPTPIKFTGAELKKNTIAPPGADASEFVIYPQFIDPIELGNNYRFLQTKKGKTDPSIIVANDNIGNGEPNARPLFSQDFIIKQGDVVLVEMQCIDKPIYDYFFSLNSIKANGPGGGATPTNPLTNISGGALGYFSAHTSSKIEVIFK